MRIESIEIGVTGDKSRFRGMLKFGSGVTVVSAGNSYGKTMAANAIGWCLGLEPLFGARNCDPSVLPGAVRDSIELRGEHQLVKSSYAKVRLRKEQEHYIEVERHIAGGDPKTVAVVDPDGKRIRLDSRRKTMADAVAGWQSFLFDWLEIPKKPVRTTTGESSVYLENIAPFFFIEQHVGWTDVGATQTHRYRQLDINDVAVEYLLGADSNLQSRFERAAREAAEARAKQEVVTLLDEIVGTFEEQGWSLKLSAHGSLSSIHKRLEGTDLLAIAEREFSFDPQKEEEHIESKIEAARSALSVDDSPTESAAARASQNVVEAKVRRSELVTQSTELRTQLEDQKGLLSAVEHRLQTTRDLERLKREGVGVIPSAECPTCHRELELASFELETGSAEHLASRIGSLDKERLLLRRNVTETEASLRATQRKLSTCNEQLWSLQRDLAGANLAVGPQREAVAKAATELARLEGELLGNRALKHRLQTLQARLDDWLNANRDFRSPEVASDEDVLSRRKVFLSKLRGHLIDLGHTAVSEPSDVGLDTDGGWTAQCRKRDLRSLGSASDRARLVAAYCTSLMEASRKLAGHHPGFLLFDEPVQQNPDEAHKALTLSFLASLASRDLEQVLVFTSLDAGECSDLRKAGVNVLEPAGDKLLTPVDR